jgi:hypothetical protein
MSPMEWLILDYEVDKLKEERKPVWIREEERKFVRQIKLRQWKNSKQD